MTKIGIFGPSGFARDVGDIALALGFEPIYVAGDQLDADCLNSDEDVVLEREIHHLGAAGFAIGIGDNLVRRRVAEKYSSQLRFVNLIHPSATFGSGQIRAIDGKVGVTVCSGVRLTNNIKVGSFTIFNLNATVGHDSIIEDFVNISPGANISGNTHIETGCWIGTGATINQGDPNQKMRIGCDTMIGSGSVVVKPCESGATYVGIPAKRIK